MTANTWETCRTLYAAAEVTWRKSLADRVADWATGCGWCGEQRDQHAVLMLISSADAVTREPLDPNVCAQILGNLPHLSPLTLASLTRAAEMALTVVGALSPDALPDEFVRSGGSQ